MLRNYKIQFYAQQNLLIEPPEPGKKRERCGGSKYPSKGRQEVRDWHSLIVKKYPTKLNPPLPKA